MKLDQVDFLVFPRIPTPVVVNMAILLITILREPVNCFVNWSKACTVKVTTNGTTTTFENTARPKIPNAMDENYGNILLSLMASHCTVLLCHNSFYSSLNPFRSQKNRTNSSTYRFLSSLES